MQPLDTRMANKKIIQENKTECCVCGESDSCCLEFHHLHDKLFNISKDSKNVSTKQLLKELSKCIVVCSNCHKKIHAKKIEIIEK